MEFPIGVSSFKELIKGDYFFVDKTLMIKDIIKDGAKVIVITRPRRFGKTLNLSMLYYFLRQNHDYEENLFEGLKISEDRAFCEKHQQQYPVIFVSFKDIKESNYAAAYNKIVSLIQELYQEHRYLLEGDILYPEQKNIFNALINRTAGQADVEAAIKKLSAYMKTKFQIEPIILIDEYDTPIQQSYLKDYYEDMIGLMRSIFGAALKDNDTLGKAVITGITRIAQESLFSGVNNLEVYTVLDEEYGQYFGFIEEEVLKLMRDSEQIISIAPIKEWYNGYQVGDYTLYNPWSIIKCLKKRGKLQSYWVATSSNDLIAHLLSEADSSVKLQFEKLLQGEVVERPISNSLVFPNLKTQEAALWSLLLYTGYLKVLSTELTEFELLAELAIPNKEIRFVYGEIIAQWFSINKNLDSYKSFIGSLTNGDVKEFITQLSKYLMQTGSFFDFNTHTSEEVFHMFIVGLVVGLMDEYIIESNRESGLGRCDVTLIPKKKEVRGILLEFKVSKSVELMLSKAQEALDQVKNKLYIERFKQHNVSSVLVIGLVFYGKQVESVHETIAIDRQ